MISELAGILINNYAEVEPKVTAAMRGNPNLLTEGVVSYVNSLPEITDEQVVNLIEFLTRTDFPPLVRFDCVRELVAGPLIRGELVSATLAMQLHGEVHLFDKRESQKREAITSIKCITEIEELPMFLSHEDVDVVEEAKSRMVYLSTCTEEEEPIKVKSYMPMTEAKRMYSERKRLARLAQDLFIAAKDPDMPERWREKTKKKAKELLAAREKLGTKGLYRR